MGVRRSATGRIPGTPEDVALTHRDVENHRVTQTQEESSGGEKPCCFSSAGDTIASGSPWPEKQVCVCVCLFAPVHLPVGVHVCAPECVFCACVSTWCGRRGTCGGIGNQPHRLIVGGTLVPWVPH